MKSSKISPIVLAIALLVFSSHGTFADQRSNDDDFVRFVVVGKLLTGRMAIGGETTGTTIQSGNATWELELNDALMRKAADLSGKTVEVAGELTYRRGVERPDRQVLAVTRLKSSARPHSIEAEIRGRITQPMFAIGGETTGVHIRAGDVSWEIDLSGLGLSREQQSAIRGKAVTVRGALVTRHGPERGRRTVIEVAKLH